MRITAYLFTCLGLIGAEAIVKACFIHSPLPVELIEDHITIDVTDQIAVKSYTCTFYNPNRQAIVGGTCYMEVEPGAQVDNMTLRLGDREVKAEILDSEKAKKVFQEIIAKGGSPALLEFYGKGLIRAQVPKIPPMGKVTAVLRYTTVLHGENGLFRLSVLNTNPKAWLKPLKRVTVQAKIRSQKPLKSIYSPTHPVDVVRKDDFNATVSFEQHNYLPRTPLALYWHVAGGDVGLTSLAHRDEEERGTFMLMMAPTLDPAKIDVLPKDIVFCIDTSGSMIEDDRIGQVKKALSYCVENLSANDRFNIVDFSTEARGFEERLVTAGPENKRRARAYVEKLVARGGTAIEESLEKSLAQFGDTTRPKMLVFLTDGTPSIGETNADRLVELAKKKNSARARIFALGVGNDVNAKLLDLLAEDNGGTTDYVLPKEDIQRRVSNFYDRISSPVLSDIEIKFQDVKVEEIFPRRTPDLFKGRQIILFGRYFADTRGPGEKKLVVTGRVNGKEVSFEYALRFPTDSKENAFLPRVWAGRKVAFLLDEIKRNGRKKELVEEVVRLARRYAIVTPYTSFLVTQDPTAPGYAKRATEAFGSTLGQWEGKAWSGRGYQSFRSAEQSLKSARGLYSLDGAGGSGEPQAVMKRVRTIGAKTFYSSGQVWYDSAYDPKKHKDPTTIKIRSAEYLKLIETTPDLVPFLSLGQVILLHRGKAYKITQG